MENFQDYCMTIVFEKSTRYHEAINPTFTISNFNLKDDVITVDYEFIALLYNDDKSENLEDCIPIHEKGKMIIDEIFTVFKESLGLEFDLDSSSRKLFILAIYRKASYVIYKSNESLKENKYFLHNNFILKNSVLTDTAWDVTKRGKCMDIGYEHKRTVKYLSQIIWGHYPYLHFSGESFIGHDASLHAAKARAAIRYLKKIK